MIVKGLKLVRARLAERDNTALGPIAPLVFDPSRKGLVKHDCYKSKDLLLGRRSPGRSGDARCIKGGRKGLVAFIMDGFSIVSIPGAKVACKVEFVGFMTDLALTSKHYVTTVLPL